MSDEEKQDEGCYLRSPHKLIMMVMFSAGVVVGVCGLLSFQVCALKTCFTNLPDSFLENPSRG